MRILTWCGIVLFLIFYMMSVSQTPHLFVFLILSAYPLFRICLDFILLTYSFINDNRTRTLIRYLSQGKIAYDKSWQARCGGITRWLIINFSVIFILRSLL